MTNKLSISSKLTLVATFVLSAVLISTTADAQYDVVINNGRVMDPETQFDGIRYVGIKDGKIATITKDKIAGAETIDATGHVVAPGFIDTQAHSAGSEWGVKVQLRDGVTTAMDFEIGAINVAKWYDNKEGKWQANFGTVAAHEYHRMRVLDKMPLPDPVDVWKLTELRGESYKENNIPDWAETVSNLEQLNAILQGLDDELRDGALGIGSTMGYMSRGVTTFEMFNVHRVAANYGRTFASHVRFLGNTSPPSEGTLGGLEQIANGVALDQPTILSHNNNYGWWEIEERLQMLRAQGYNIWSEYYPYTAGSTTIGAEFLKPENIAGAGMSYERMFNPQTGEFMSQEEYEKIVAENPGFIIVAFIDAREPWLPSIRNRSGLAATTVFNNGASCICRVQEPKAICSSGLTSSGTMTGAGLCCTVLQAVSNATVKRKSIRMVIPLISAQCVFVNLPIFHDQA